MATNLVILDRDGVINEDSDAYIKSPAEWHPIPGSLHAIARLRHAGYRVAVATNQSGIRRGLFDPEVLNQIHDRMHRMLAEVGGQIEAVVYCPCLPRDRCDCRKPKPGMLLEIARRMRVSLDGVPVVGDAMRDIDAARAAGATPVLVRTGKGRRTESSAPPGALDGVAVHDDLASYVESLLATPPA
ncbi:MAG: D-glycero-beta-D-manno-heptose 1,7-bisphosphate 7-phosphatase [Ectothiorhodospiraceae bacterium]|nr:D-glycero-beta-D-manno-heptose 1,7-bisphosphate 7-phosphatase [Ectothiorhodospiraceae bacterium]